MKKLNENELRVLFSVIVGKISEERWRNLEKEIKRGKEWKRLEKLDVELREMNERLIKLNGEWNDLVGVVSREWGVNVSRSGRRGELKGWFVNDLGFGGMGMNNGLWGDLVIMSMGDDDVDVFIEKMVKKWSK